MSRLILALVLLSVITPLQAQQVEVLGARVWPAPDQTRVVIDTAAVVSHKIFSLDNPHRLVIDIPDARLTGKLPIVESGDPVLAGMRSGIRAGDDLRLVLDLKQAVRVKSFLLRPNERYGHRLVVDLSPSGGDTGAAALRTAPHRSVGSSRKMLREIVVAIDAGHGGDDPGAIGANGAQEKDITLAIARKLARLVKRERGMRPVLIRDGDYYVSLRRRIAIARKNQADVFVSIHADAFNDPRVSGSSVYTLSYRGASSEAAKWLADKENSADLIGGIDLSESDDELATVLLDMTQNATMEHSTLAAQKVLDNLKRLGDVHKSRVQKAGFVVLKAPDIPSMLVETAYISNPDEEKRLRDRGYQAHLAEAILGGIKDYLERFPPPGTMLAAKEASRRHVINRGDTLGEIAKLYDVSLASLRSANQINGDVIQEGQVLTIPGS
jgi:N-acetylmuramoyl-L-alanine amidase